ncbi:NADP-dependent oxidoreductase domain-containing protein [Ilyonectria sp. MPI-CAGE-AT-0026]|nr:NADP-dependent oxidoreductase domain-containing protein [Ilyonectria sp. MPI-CAGE-AT-0026]
MAATPVALVVGTHTWGLDDGARVDSILDLMRKHKIGALDTARIYGQGASEAVLGTKHLTPEFTVDTKAATGINLGSGGRILEFANESRDALLPNKIRTYFLHGPDEATPIEQQMESIQALYQQGLFTQFGLSNFSKEQVLECYNYAKSKGYVLPTVYQSNYSIAARLNETLLFPTLRELGFSIQAYSPMAAGLLAKTPEDIEQGKGSWDPDTIQGRIYRDLYYKPSYMKMLLEFGNLSGKSGVSRMALAYRWVRYHSALKRDLGDEMILGAASVAQLEESLEELEKGPLENWVVERIDELWDIVKEDAPQDNIESARKFM